MANFVVDTFTDTTGTNLQSHTGETGATWATNPDYPSNVKVSSLGDLFCPSGVGVYYASGVPVTADYEIEADLVVKSVAGSGGVMGRMNATSPVAFYWARYLTNKWELYASTTNNATLIGQYSQTLNVGQTYNLRLRMVGSSIKVLIDDVERISVTSNTLTDKGLAGLAMASGGATEATGIQIVNYSATDIVTLSIFPTQAPKNASQYTLTITGNGSLWDDDTVFTVDGEGVSKISQEILSTTSAQVVISTSDDLGEVTVSDGEVEGTFEVTAATKQIVFDGNSLTVGYGASLSFDYPSQMLIILNDGSWTGQNFGVSSQTTTDMIEDAVETIDALYNAQYDENVLIAWEITNDLYFGATKEDAYSRFVKYCKLRRAAGWKVFVITVLPRTGGSPPEDFEESRAYCNTKLRNNWRKFADGIIDLAGDIRYSDATDTEHFPDNTHLSNDGYGTVAAYAASVLFQYLTEEEETTTPEPTTDPTTCYTCGSTCKKLRLIRNAYVPGITVCNDRL